MADAVEPGAILALEDAYRDSVQNMDPALQRRIETDALEGSESNWPFVEVAKDLWTKLVAAKLASGGAIVDASGTLVHHHV